MRSQRHAYDTKAASAAAPNELAPHQRKPKNPWVDRLLILAVIACLGAGAFLLIRPRVIKQRQDQITHQLNERIESGLMEPIVVPRDANMVEGESYDFYGKDSHINYQDLPEEENVELIPLARLEIPKIHVNLPILEGATNVQLRYGLAHVTETAKPGENGNAAMLGHRMLDSGRHLNRLNEVEAGDKITINTGTDLYTYEVTDMPVIDPEVLMDYVERDYGEPTITLITCHPIPSWSHRLLCIARQTDHQVLQPADSGAETGTESED